MSERAYEKAVDLAASLAWYFSTQEAQVSFIVPGRPRTGDLHEYLGWLAVIEPGAREACPAPETVAGQKEPYSPDTLTGMNLGNSDAYNIVITARPRGSLPAALWNCSYFVFAGDGEAQNGSR